MLKILLGFGLGTGFGALLFFYACHNNYIELISERPGHYKNYVNVFDYDDVNYLGKSYLSTFSSDVLLKELQSKKFDFNSSLSKAQAGDKEAMVDVAVAYCEGYQCEKSLKDGYNFLKKAVKSAADSKNCFVFAYYLSCDDSDDKQVTDKEISDLLIRGCKISLEDTDNNSDIYSRMCLFDAARYYFKGKNVEFKSTSLCLKYLYKAAELGDDRAQLALGKLYMLPDDFKSYRIQARRCYEDAARQGNAEACYYLAQCYEYGIGVKCSEKDALSWYKKAKDGNYADAVNKITALEDKLSKNSGKK